MNASEGQVGSMIQNDRFLKSEFFTAVVAPLRENLHYYCVFAVRKHCSAAKIILPEFWLMVDFLLH